MGAGFSSCTPRVICSRVSAPILVDEATSSDGKPKTRRRTVHELIQDRCPSMYASFKPVWWLCNGRLQTFYSVLGDFTKVDQVVYDRVLLKLRDSGTIGLDFSPPKHENRSFAEDTPVVVVLHGLTGGSYESYIRTILSSAIATVEEGGLGYRAVVINSRGCAGVPLTSPHLYSSGRTTDIRAALLYIQHLYPNAPLLGIGFSMGAGVLTKYLSEEGQESRLVSACAVAAPWDMLAMNDRLTNDFFCRNVYSKALARNCQAILVQHASEIAQWPESHLARVFPTVCGNKSLTAVEFDELVSRVVGGPTPPWPLEDALAYYAYVSTDQYLPQVRVPFLSLDAEDDPIATGTPVHCTNPWVVFVKTAIGGHVGWFAHEDGSIKRWLRKPVLEWLRATGEGMRVEKRKPRDVICRDGWLIDAGAEEIGVYVSSSASSVLPPEPDSRSALLAGL